MKYVIYVTSSEYEALANAYCYKLNFELESPHINSDHLAMVFVSGPFEYLSELSRVFGVKIHELKDLCIGCGS